MSKTSVLSIPASEVTIMQYVLPQMARQFLQVVSYDTERAASMVAGMARCLNRHFPALDMAEAFNNAVKLVGDYNENVALACRSGADHTVLRWVRPDMFEALQIARNQLDILAPQA